MCDVYFLGTDLKLHQCVAGFMCDMLLLGAAIQPVVPGTKVGYMASLDHSMWFHNPFRANEWMLYEIECPQCGMYLFINRYYGDIHVLKIVVETVLNWIYIYLCNQCLSLQ